MMRREGTATAGSSKSARGRPWRRWGWGLGCASIALVGGAALLGGCGKAVSAPHVGSETHFIACAGQRDCPDELSCLDGVCTQACGADADCGGLAPQAVCIASLVDGTRSCQLECSSDAECSASFPNRSCRAGRCRAPARAGIGSAEEPSALSSPCPEQPETSSELFDIDTSVVPVPGSRLVSVAVADDRGVYWAETDGSLLTLPHGSEESVLLRGPTEPSGVFAMLSDADYIYWSELEPRPGEGVMPSSPATGRLFRVASAGGAPELVVETAGFLQPVGTSAGAIFVTVDGANLFDVESGALRRVSSVPEGRSPTVHDGRAYWTDGNADVTQLFSAPLAGGSATRVGTIEREYWVGRGLVLWTERRPGPQTQWPPAGLVRLDLDTGCVSRLPELRQGIASAVIDDRHVYWQSVKSTDPRTLYEDTSLVRVNLATSRLERLVSPALASAQRPEILAQDSQRLYVRVTGPLLAVRKPE